MAMVTAFMVMLLLAAAAASYVTAATADLRMTKRQWLEMQTTNLCEAGVQTELLALWKPLKQSQDFTSIDAMKKASASSPQASSAGTITGIGNYAVAVTGVTAPDPYSRTVTISSVGWIDESKTGQISQYDPQKIINVMAKFQLQRSGVFDYTYFVNNYGWMQGFSPSNLIVNGDMRANGDFNFTGGVPTVNGSVYACSNAKLIPGAAGIVNTPPAKYTTANYITQAANNPRWRPGYNASLDGVQGSAQYEQTRDLVYDANGAVVNGRLAGTALCDANGERSWQAGTSGQILQTLDTAPTQELPMPDLSNISLYTNLSANYKDPKQTYLDGTPNPTYNQGAYLKVWDSTANKGAGAYVMLSKGGVVTGSASVVGDATHPVIIHGPVTFTQDVAIKGVISGQGTIYAGRNVHIVGSITYANPPDFRVSDPTAADDLNEKKDLLGLAAGGSVIMGDTSTFGSGNLQYMTPPFTKDRYDANGNLVKAFDANQVDSTGFKKYQSTLGDSVIHSLSSPIAQIDAIMYTNNVGGGLLGTSSGVTINGSLISKDEAMVVSGLPMEMNYDNRIKERGPTHQALIDVALPRDPVLYTANWQDQSFVYHGVKSNNGKGKGKGGNGNHYGWGP